ncbi:MAG: prolyl aminopeptidase [Hyphomicrobiaceae bacterium]
MSQVSQGMRYGLYPVIEPYDSGMLDVGDGHQVYYEQSGNPDGLPAVVVHGGPGGGTNPNMRRFHDPAHYRIVLFDQRGCGRSTPNASLHANTTWHLVGDMERLRSHLGIQRWHLFGGSWGSTLSLAYSQTHPGRVLGLVLRGIFLLRQKELSWFYQEGCSWIFPEAYALFAKPIPLAERGDMIAAYHRRLTGRDRAVQLEAARAWSMWEGSTLSLIQDPNRIRLFGIDDYARAFARIECHYFFNNGFLDSDGQLLQNAHLLKDVPGFIVQGRYDVITPMQNAVDLEAVWPAAELRVVPDAGHAVSEPGVVHELVRATQAFILDT